MGRPPIPLPASGLSPLWTPEGDELIFEDAGLTVIEADGSRSEAERVFPEGPAHHHPLAWTPDGLELVYVEIADNLGDLLAVRRGEQEPRVILGSEFSEGREGASLSPIGRWLAYTSDSTGQWEVWVLRYSGSGAPQRISPNGGEDPVWSRDGSELFYLEGARMMAVSVTTDGEEFEFGPATFLFDARPQRQTTQPPYYDVAPDGRFILVRRPEGGQASIRVIQDWFEELKRLVPVQ